MLQGKDLDKAVLGVQYSEDIVLTDKEQAGLSYPLTDDPRFTWENIFIPIEHMGANNRKLNGHIWARYKTSNEAWSAPIRLAIPTKTIKQITIEIVD